MAISQKQPGDVLEAKTVNAIADGLQDAPSKIDIPTPWAQRIVQVKSDVVSATDTANSGLYAVRINSFESNPDDPGPVTEQWLLDTTEFEEVVLSIGDKLVAWWNPQRGAFIPATGRFGGKCQSFVDIAAPRQEIVAKQSPTFPDPFIHYSLEVSETGVGDWFIPNKLVGYISGVDPGWHFPTQEPDRVVLSDVDEEQSGTCMYTLFVDKPMWVRVVVFGEVDADATLIAEWIGLKMESWSPNGSAHETRAKLDNGQQISDWEFQVQVANEGPAAEELVNQNTPKFALENDDKIVKIEPPGEQGWTVLVEVGILISFETASSQSSSSSTSSQSSSSMSSESSSSGDSSSSSSSESSSSSSSSSSVSSSSSSSVSSSSSSSESSLSSSSSMSSSSSESSSMSSSSSKSSSSSPSSTPSSV